MSRVLLVHWNEPEARERAARLRALGHRVQVHASPDSRILPSVPRDPPEVVIIDLARLPSHGREVGARFRQRKGTRHVSLVFVKGDPEKTARVQSLLPDAIFTTWAGIGGALKRALAAPLREPVVPGAMAGYSGTPLPQKLGIRPGVRVSLIGAPRDVVARIAPLPEGARLVAGTRGPAPLVLLFTPSRRELSRRFPGALRGLADGGALWILWPKKTSGMNSDLGEAEVRRYGLDRGLVDYKICALDATWSGLRFARRAGVSRR